MQLGIEECRCGLTSSGNHGFYLTLQEASTKWQRARQRSGRVCRFRQHYLVLRLRCWAWAAWQELTHPAS